ncbi:hypothetical protein PRIPAC_91165, partial [Pristionchus pacificus]
ERFAPLLIILSVLVVVASSAIPENAKPLPVEDRIPEVLKCKVSFDTATTPHQLEKQHF